MFDAEERIRRWRRELAETGRCSGETIDELESHLRESFQQFVRAGHSPEQALEMALARLGTPQALAAEFAKVPPPGLAPWLPVRLAYLAMIALAAWLLGI